MNINDWRKEYASLAYSWRELLNNIGDNTLPPRCRQASLETLQDRFDAGKLCIVDLETILSQLNFLIMALPSSHALWTDLRLLSADIDEYLAEPAIDYSQEAPPRWAGNSVWGE